MMTPYLQPSILSEQQFNAYHMKARNSIERCVGVWKGRFRSLDRTGGPLFIASFKGMQGITYRISSVYFIIL